MRGPAIAISLLAAVTLSCGVEDVELGGGPGGGVSKFADAAPGSPDARPNAGCSPGAAACDNCIDDDGDGLIDGFDPGCISTDDDDESRFGGGSVSATDRTTQDCGYDDNNGFGDDRCSVHVCCILDDCPDSLAGGFDPASCAGAVTEECARNCGPLVPPGCDCFGCCTICGPGGTCASVMTNPALAPACTTDALGDPARCPSCTPSPACNGGTCAADCALCPGQQPGDLPAACGGVNACPGPGAACATSADCNEREYCAVGCCIRAP